MYQYLHVGSSQGIPRIQGNIVPSYCMVKHLRMSTDLAAHNFVHFLLQTGATSCTFTSKEKKQQPKVWIYMYDYTCIWPVYNAYMATLRMQLVSIAVNILHIQGLNQLWSKLSATNYLLTKYPLDMNFILHKKGTNNFVLPFIFSTWFFSFPRNAQKGH